MNTHNLSEEDINLQLNNVKSSFNKTENKKNKTHISKKTINDILNDNIEALESFMDSKVINLFERPWNKLEYKFKKIKIEEFFENKFKNNELTNDKKNEEINRVLKSIKLNKVKIIYDLKECQIKEIKEIK